LFFAVFKSATEAGEKSSYDYVLCTHKALHQDAAVEDLKPLIKPHSTIVIAQNGVGNEDLFRERYPQNSIISFAVSFQTTLPKLYLNPYFRFGLEQTSSDLENFSPAIENTQTWAYSQTLTSTQHWNSNTLRPWPHF